MMVVRLLALVAALASLTVQTSIVLDHVVFAVNDLEAAAARFRSFGFALKPGRPHENGIRNEHVKFADGTELELLTAAEARDDLTKKYRQHLAAGDGAAYLALMVRGGPAPTEKPPYIFFGGRNASPTDRPEHFAHANTAESLVAVWLAGADFKEERALLARYNAKGAARQRTLLGVVAQVIDLAEGGAVYLLPAGARLKPDRPIVGVTFGVKSVPAAAKVLRDAGVTYATDSSGSLLLTPPTTGGLWIELQRSLRPTSR
jgi:catechol 2,3-dioxygenase-like lactoylglutathione lyase family enzyme